ncbi:MAG: hypothetical protein AMXMBFR23_01660 [Chloroflexota bacterium]
MPASNIGRLRETLDELFMLDRADLDFGLYRIMNVRRDEVRRFLDHDLLPKVREALGQMQEGERAALRQQIEEATQQARALGFDNPSDAPRVRELSERYEAGGDTEADEAEVYGHLVSFFRRYYKEGDFISLRRYKEGVYAIPYEGEEVKLHWANADQYYIKSTEQFRDYTFLVSHEDEPERRVHFRLVEADSERNNNRAQAGQERRFVLVEGDPVEEVDGDLVVRFEYRPADGAKQDALNTEAEATVLDHPAAKAWRAVLARDVRREGAKDSLSLLRKHLNTYTAKNTFDYFIHKDLGGFLRRELNFYIKNEVLRLDDIDTPEATSATLDAALRKVRAIRAVGLPIIEFLASLEEFQKRLWLKKKFVVETHWCVTLDRVPRELYPEIAANDRQRAEWVRLFAIDEITGDMVSPAYSAALSEAFLQANQHLILDTSFFDRGFTERLLASIDDLDETTDGLLVHGENFQALSLLERRYRNQVDTVYIDPPYNTAATQILYKNDYRHSSWCSLMADRLAQSQDLLSESGVHQIAIDDTEFHRLGMIVSDLFGQDQHLGNIVVMHNPKGRDQGHIAAAHEYTIVVARDAESAVTYRLPLEAGEVEKKYSKGGDGEERHRELPLRRSGSAASRADRPRMYYPFTCDPRDGAIDVVPRDEFERIFDGAKFDDEFVESLREKYEAAGLVFILPVRDDGSLGRWRWGYEKARAGCQSGVLFAKVGAKPTVYQKDAADETVLPKTLWFGERHDASSKGTNLLRAMVGDNPFEYPKSVLTVMDMVSIGTPSEGLVLDYFAGSGTTGHAVINLNREDGGERKYILVEMGEYFDTVLKPRVLKAIYSKDWKDGKPVGREGVSQLIKVIRLESYEDTLTNLRIPKPSEQQASMLAKAGDDLRQQYALRYWLTEETRGSASLLDLERFEDPWSYTLEVGQGSAAETKPVTVDLVETFNYLLGLRVQHVSSHRERGALRVEGRTPPSPGHPEGEKVLVVWRNTRVMDAEGLNQYLGRLDINPRDLEFDVIYVNGDNHLENTRRADESWKVRLIEEEFHRLMFETAEQERKQ